MMMKCRVCRARKASSVHSSIRPLTITPPVHPLQFIQHYYHPLASPQVIHLTPNLPFINNTTRPSHSQPPTDPLNRSNAMVVPAVAATASASNLTASATTAPPAPPPPASSRHRLRTLARSAPTAHAQTVASPRPSAMATAPNALAASPKRLTATMTAVRRRAGRGASTIRLSPQPLRPWSLRLRHLRRRRAAGAC
jgi:hypothetical protein